MPRKASRLVSIILIALFITGCAVINPNNSTYVVIVDSGTFTRVETTAGETVEQVLSSNQVSLGPIDRVDPPVSAILAGGETIVITRVRTEYQVIETILPFEQQLVKNESLPEGKSVLIQPGINGQSQTTYRILFENGVEVSRTIVKNEVVQQAKPELVMIGVQSENLPVEINGVLAFISLSNAWVLENNTGNRKIVVSTGDLDDRVFTLSPDRRWLLFSRSTDETANNMINSLWIVDITAENPQPIDTLIRNVVHFADWIPNRDLSIAYSTVEPRAAAPGWQANNDLRIASFDDTGKVTVNSILVNRNPGGLSGWWGTNFSWSPDGSKLVYAKPDSIGMVDTHTGEQSVIIEFSPYNPKSDWAWIPAIALSVNNTALYTTLPSWSPGSGPTFDLSAILLDGMHLLPVVPQCGLFCNPVPSAESSHGNILVGYLSAIQPDNSEASDYNLNVMDRDGSNRKRLFPGEGQQGLEPQYIAWSPIGENNPNFTIAFLAQGNLMLVDVEQGNVKQVTGDGMITKITWR